MAEVIVYYPEREPGLRDPGFVEGGIVGELVRCKDCKWWDKKGESPYGYCHACKHGYSSPNWEIGIYRTYKGDFFCADGEKKGAD